jgi:hypothetical protein
VQSTFFGNRRPRGVPAIMFDDYLRTDFFPVAETIIGDAGDR